MMTRLVFLILQLATLYGVSTRIPEATILEFSGTVKRGVILPNDDRYEAARKVWNGMIDRHPGMIVQCTSITDVVNAVNFARTHNLLVAVRGGGHSVAGNAVCDGGLVIDLSGMKGITVDHLNHIARAEGGVTWGELDSETQRFGLATTGGIVSTTGIAGLTLGGGLGFLMRKYGLSCDNLLGVEIVTADGRVLKANAQENPDLFWAVRGGGGNFGVVTSFEYRLHSIGKILFGPVIYPAERGREVLLFYRRFMEEAPDELQAYAGLLRGPDGAPIVVVVAAYFGPVDDGHRVLGPLREFASPTADQIKPILYTDHRVLFDAYYQTGIRNYWKANFLAELSDEAIDTMVRHFARAPSPFPALALECMGGAAARVRRDETAFDHRDAPFNFLITDGWRDPAEDKVHRKWVRDVWEAMQPYSAGGVYVNYMQDEKDEGRSRVEAAYGTRYQRLAELKRKYDRTNLFRLNQNIRPSS